MSILTKIWAFVSGAVRKVKEALTTGKSIANQIKAVADSQLLDVIVNLTVTGVDNLALLSIRNGLTIWITKMNWAEKKISDFDETTLPHVMNSINAEAAKLKAEFINADLTRQQAIASAQVVYDESIVKV